MRRKLAIIAVSVAAAALIAVAALPWWLGAALSTVGGRYGFTFAEYHRLGYSRFALAGIRVKTGNVEVKASRVELGTPLFWLLQKPGEVRVEEWSVDVAKPVTAREPRARGWLVLRTRLERILRPLENWLPPATAGSGMVTWPGGRLDFGAVAWTPGRLQVDPLRWRQLSASVVLTHDEGADRLEANGTLIDGDGRLTATSEGATVTARGDWRGQPITLSAEFDPTGWLPREAQADAKAWSVPGAQLKLADYYTAVTGDARVTWKERALAVDIEAAGTPVAGTDAPPLQAVLHGSGAVNRLSIDRLELTLPGVTATLSEPIALQRSGQLLSGASRFELKADLAKQPWFKGGGQVTGSVNVTPRGTDVPQVSLKLSAADLVIADWAAPQAGLEMQVEWPQIKVVTANVDMTGGDNVTLSGQWAADTRTLSDGHLAAQISRATVARWLPASVDFEKINIEAQAGGAWPAIKHTGKVDAQAVRVAPLRALTGFALWSGQGEAVSDVKVTAAAGETQVQLAGSVEARSARITELVLTQGAAERLRLANPAQIAWSPALKIDPLEFTGTNARVAGQIDWVERGAIDLNVLNFESAWLRDVVELRGPAWTLNALEAHGSWEQGPLVFTATGGASMAFKAGRQAELAWSARGDGAGVAVERLRATMEERPVVTATGKLPLTIWPWSDWRVRMDEDAPLLLDALTEPHAVFWEQLAQLTGVVFTAPDVNLKLSGTLKSPGGEGRINIGKIAPGEADWARSLPEVENIQARLTGNRGELALETFTATVSGQSIRASARLPVADWALLVQDPLALAAAQGEARIEIPGADLAALTRYAPAYLSPVGKLEVDVSLKPGGLLYGRLALKDAATRPLGPLGILQSIGAEITLDGRTVTLKEVRATSGGQPVTLTGTASLPAKNDPRLNLTLKGANLPFVRQAGLLVRGDVDLHIETGDDNVTRITGGTRLRDSLFLMDVRALLPSGGPRNAPGRRPPYFAVTMAPFNAWTLDVTVTGDRFLRLRTPVFNGVASANFRLGGTLGDPRVLGEAVVNEGQVMLPFATFAVRQGWVRITEANPFEPQISLTGTSRRFNYDLRMEINGTVERPELSFSSTPSLESEQVLLMVMAGETPQNDISYSGSERAARLGAYLGQSLLSQLGTDSATQDRLSVNVGERISRQGRETYGIEYTLNPRWALVGEYDEFDEYNVGVKWRVLSQQKTTPQPKEPVDDKK